MVVKFTVHAIDQMPLRGIGREEVIEALDRPRETIVTKGGRLASYALIEERYIVVVHEKGNGEDVGITAMKVNKRKLRRLGFTKI